MAQSKVEAPIETHAEARSVATMLGVSVGDVYCAAFRHIRAHYQTDQVLDFIKDGLPPKVEAAKPEQAAKPKKVAKKKKA
jgi:hypothetical protein